MASSDRLIGFSTGALSKGDFRRGLELLRARSIKTVELSALRENELPILSEAIRNLDLSDFEHVSVHSPSNLVQLSEEETIRYLSPIAELSIPIIVHPDTMHEERWRTLGNLLWIENLDKRKSRGRTVSEMEDIFSSFPDAAFCFDIAHARQVDPTMVEAAQMLRSFNDRLRQIHASGLNSASRHSPMSAASSFAIARVSHLIPSSVPVILESTVAPEGIDDEVNFARAAFSPWFGRLSADIDAVFAFATLSLRERQVTSFLSCMAASGAKLHDFETVIRHLPAGGAYSPGSPFVDTRELLARLSEDERLKLQQHLEERLRTVRE